MIRIIETNLILDDNDKIIDHQSRVIEVNSWEKFVNEIKNQETVDRISIFGDLRGVTIPKKAKIENLKYDDKTISCDVTTYMGNKIKKLIYKI